MKNINKKGASGTGAKWFLGMVIYFALSLFIVILVSGFKGDEINSDFGKEVNAFCSSPRTLYTPYDFLEEETFSKYDINDLSHLDCSKSQGVLSNESCSNFNGCEWGILSGEDESTCFGYINALHYEIDTFKSFFEKYPKVKRHDNTDGISLNFGSICNHPNVIYNYDLCSLFSCTWNGQTGLTNIQNMIEADNLPLITNINVFSVRHIWSTTKELFTFKLDLGVENETANLLILFTLSWLPLIILLLSIYVMIRG